MIMKILLMVAVFLAVSAVGVIMYLRYLIRFNLYKDLKYICSNLKNNISFSKDKIGVLLKNCSVGLSKSSRLVLFSDTQFYLIKPADKSNVQLFLSSLGKGDVQFEVNNITYFENMFSDLKDRAYDELKKNGTTYLKLSFCLSIALCIMLL